MKCQHMMLRWKNKEEIKMSLTQTKAKELSAILDANPEQAREWLTLEPEKAVVEINKLGHSFTYEELKEYGRAIKAAAGDLSDSELENVAGGVAVDAEADAIHPVVILPAVIRPLPLIQPTPSPIVVRPLPITNVKW